MEWLNVLGTILMIVAFGILLFGYATYRNDYRFTIANVVGGVLIFIAMLCGLLATKKKAKVKNKTKEA